MRIDPAGQLVCTRCSREHMPKDPGCVGVLYPMWVADYYRRLMRSLRSVTRR